MKSEYFAQKYVVWNTPRENLFDSCLQYLSFADHSASNATYHIVCLVSARYGKIFRTHVGRIYVTHNCYIYIYHGMYILSPHFHVKACDELDMSS